MILAENVVMADESDSKYFSDALQSQPVMIDAADAGLISRPRLWWSRVDWSKVKQHPFTGQPLQWTQHNQHRRLRLGLPVATTTNWDMEGHALHDDVVQGRKKVPCFTTPAPDEFGRAPPKHSRGRVDSETKQRWLQHNRQFAPWQYAEHAMACKHGQLVPMPAVLKEQLHHYPANFTHVPGVPDKARHRMMANSWHVLVAAFILALVLQVAPANAAPTPALHLQESAIHTVLQLGSQQMAQAGPGQWPMRGTAFQPTSTMMEHWRTAIQTLHPAQTCSTLEPGLESTLQAHMSHQHRLATLRQRVVSEVRSMVDLWKPTTQTWFEQLPFELQDVYSAKGTKLITQVPLLIHLLKLCGFEGTAELEEDLTQGFPMVGQIHSGSGWLPRKDERYSCPISMSKFHELNKAYVKDKLQKPKPSAHWRTMLDELLQDKAKGRVQGPFLAPASWQLQTVGVEGHPCQPPPTEEVYPALCFAVEQHDKVRRCEDFRRSFHNSTVAVDDCPHHHDLDLYIKLLQRLQAYDAGTPMIWGEDLDSAYRQLPVRPDPYCYTMLVVDTGVTLWRHTAAPFGATAAVWSFNRFADALVAVSRRLLMLPLGHFVDDFTGIDIPALAHGGCKAFKDLFNALGLDMKPSKEQLPATSQRVLGVVLSCNDSHIEVAACPERRAKVQQALQAALDTNHLTAHDAQQLAGKMAFLTTTFFGGVGRAALLPLYARGHGLGEKVHDKLTHALRQAIVTLLFILNDARPREIPFVCGAGSQHAVLYTDAFFALGSSQFKVGAGHVPENWSPQRTKASNNGWGFVIHTLVGCWYSFGKIPDWFVAQFTTRRAYIYMLEVLAVLIAVTFMRSHLPHLFTVYIDNQSGKCALQKGYGKDPKVNLIVSAFWAMMAHHQLHPCFQYVRPDQNISDAVSRQDDSTAEALGWKRVHVDVEPFLETLSRALVTSCADLNGLVQALNTFSILFDTSQVGGCELGLAAVKLASSQVTSSGSSQSTKLKPARKDKKIEKCESHHFSIRARKDMS